MTVDPAKSESASQYYRRTFRPPPRRLPGQIRRRAGALPSSAPAAPAPVPAGTIFTCPRCGRSGRGACPICGMALSPWPGWAKRRTHRAPPPLVRAHAGDPRCRPRHGRTSLRADWLAPQVSNWLQLVLATPASGRSSLRAAASIRTGAFNMFTLIATGVGVAWLAKRRRDRRAGGFSARLPYSIAPPVYFEAAAVITGARVGRQVLEPTARERTGDGAGALLSSAKRALRIATAASRTSISTASPSATCCASGRARSPGGRPARRGRAPSTRRRRASRCGPEGRRSQTDRGRGQLVGRPRHAGRAGRSGVTLRGAHDRSRGEGPAQPRAGAAPGRRAAGSCPLSLSWRSPFLLGVLGPSSVAFGLVAAVSVLIIAARAVWAPYRCRSWSASARARGRTPGGRGGAGAVETWTRCHR